MKQSRVIAFVSIATIVTAAGLIPFHFFDRRDDEQRELSTNGVEESDNAGEPNEGGSLREQADAPAIEPRPIVAGQVWIYEDLYELNATGIELFAGNADAAVAQLEAFPGVTQKIFVFSDGEALAIPIYSTPPQTPSPGTVNLDDGQSGFYERMVPFAQQGDGGIAHQLYEELRSCQSHPTTQDDLNERVQRLRASGLSETDLQHQVSYVEQRFDRCEGVTEAMMDSTLEFLRSAADLGDIRSAITLANHFRETDPSFASSYYREAWEEAGSSEGLDGLAQTLAGSRSVQSTEELVIAFAYRYAADVIELSLKDGLDHQIWARHRAELIDRLSTTEALASPEVVARGTEAAKRLITSNTACCNVFP